MKREETASLAERIEEVAEDLDGEVNRWTQDQRPMSMADEWLAERVYELRHIAAKVRSAQDGPVAWIAASDLELLKYGGHPIAGAKTAPDDIPLYLEPLL